ncbi:hypothetical protein [Shinella sp.]|uniref:hypothetical protein n=1 Tax=Shinella sp. TaxID=1870904 RepID=UPI00258F2158|nr:hypothetical protein [Shinella sp.]MCW5710614.1 hypothetical protein [Shinella sp.]
MFVQKFYIADTHFRHERILTLQPRPFPSIDAHDNAIVERWNAVVRDDDIVYHLGDFAFRLGERFDKLHWLFSRLKGRKHLVLGNHDVTSRGEIHPHLAALDWAAPPAHALRTRDGGREIYLSHYACRTWPCQHYGAVHFYGHSHGHLPGTGLSRDVGVDLPDVDFTPRTFDELTKEMFR